MAASAETSEVTVKPARPARKRFLRPYLSPSRPPMSSPAAMAMVYPAASHWMNSCEPPMSRVIVGPAMVVTRESSTSMTSPTRMMPTAAHARLGENEGPSGKATACGIPVVDMLTSWGRDS